MALSPFKSQCRREDLNLHAHKGHQVLNLASSMILTLNLGCESVGVPLLHMTYTISALILRLEHIDGKRTMLPLICH